MTMPVWSQGLGLSGGYAPMMDTSGVGVSVNASVGGGAPPSNAVGMAIVLGGLIILYLATRNIQGSR